MPLEDVSKMKGMMLEYINEWQKINDSIEPACDKDCVESLFDESEQASEFLTSVGFENIIPTAKDDVEDHQMYQDLEQFLTKNQVATIRKRVDTLRKKGGNRTHRKDVRSLFLDDEQARKEFQQKDVPEEETKLNAKFKQRRGSPFRSSVNATADPELIGSNVLFSSFNEPVSCGKNRNSGDHTDGHMPLPVIFPDKVTNICLERTLIDDLGKRDLKMLEALAQIELMGVFDKFRINFPKQKSKKKIRDKEGVFGVRLQVLLERDLKTDPSTKMPKFFHQLLTYLEKNCLNEEGILRLSGSFTRIKEIRSEIDNLWPFVKFSFEGLRPNDASGLMKIFLRDLPSPLLTFEWLDSFIQIAKIPNIVMQIYCLSLLMLLLPEVHRNTLKRLLEFLRRVGEHSESNLMTEDSVAMIMAPNLFLVGSPSSPSVSSSGNSGAGPSSDLDRDLFVATTTTAVILLMIRHQEEMFEVPAGLINQIREKNQENKKKAMKKFWGKKKSELNRLPENILVSLQFDSHSEDLSFQLKLDSTATDVLCSIISRLMCADEYKTTQEIVANFSLHEIGGNIEERRLDPTSSMVNVIHVNPHAKYAVRKKPFNIISTATDV